MKLQIDLASGLTDPVVKRIGQRFDALYANQHYVRWEDYFPPRPGDVAKALPFRKGAATDSTIATMYGMEEQRDPCVFEEPVGLPFRETMTPAEHKACGDFVIL